MRAKEKTRAPGRLLSIDELQSYIGVGRNSALKFGKEAGALLRIGKRVLFDRDRIDKAIDAMTR